MNDQVRVVVRCRQGAADLTAMRGRGHATSSFSWPTPDTPPDIASGVGDRGDARVAATSSPRTVRGYLCRLVLVLGRGLRRTRRGDAREPRFIRVARERRHGGCDLER